jgi:hypothetical protein
LNNIGNVEDGERHIHHIDHISKSSYRIR